MTLLDTPATSRSAPAPLAAARASVVGVILAVALIGIGVVGVRDAAVGAGWVHGEPWLRSAFGALDELSPQTWVLPVGLAVAAVGLVLVVTALLPRRATAVPVDAASAVYVRLGDVARVATAAALDVPGVTAADSTASSRRVLVRCRVTGDDHDVRALIADAVGTALQPLTRTPRVDVRVRREART